MHTEQETQEDLRKQLNELLEEKRFEEAVGVANRLRDSLRGVDGDLDVTQLKMLAGVEDLLRRHGPSKTSMAGSRPIAGLVLVVVALVGLGSFIYMKTTPDGRYRRDLDATLAALDRIEATVRGGVTLNDYRREVMALRDATGSFAGDHLDRGEKDVTFEGAMLSRNLYDAVLTAWEKGPDAYKGSTFSSTTGPRPCLDLWNAARMASEAARTAMRKERPTHTRDMSTPSGRLVGHWTNDISDVWYSPEVNGVCCEVLVHHKTNLTYLACCFIDSTVGDEVHLRRLFFGQPMELGVLSIPTDGARYTEGPDVFKRVDDVTMP